MTEEEKAVFNAAITLAKYCKQFGEDCCTGCIFEKEDDDCGIGYPTEFRIPAALCEKKE